MSILICFVIMPPKAVEICVLGAMFVLAGAEVIWGAIGSVARGRFFGENFMMAVVGIAAFAIGEYMEGVAIMIFFGFGELFQDMAVEHSRRSVTKLLALRPDIVSVRRGNEIIQIDPKDVHIGETIIIGVGERVAIDGVCTAGETFLDTRAITGEPVPRAVAVGGEVLSGTVNTQSQIEVRVTKLFGESTVAKILDLVERASSKKSTSEKFITKFAKVFTPVIMVIAVLVALVPPLLHLGSFSTYVYRAVCFIAVSCPCALVMSIPLGIFGGIGGAARNGILIKGGNYLETLNSVTVAAFDKTGTLTKGVFEVSQVITNGITERDLLALVAGAEAHSPHPIAKSIIAHCKSLGIIPLAAQNIKEISGKGVNAKIGDQTVCVGNKNFVENQGISPLPSYTKTSVYVLANGAYLGCILIADKVKDNAAAAIRELELVGIRETIMLTGDNEQSAKDVAGDLGITRYFANLLPQDKVAAFEKIKAETTGKIAFIGDGINDAPVLTRADVGIAVVGDLGNDAAVEAADIVLLQNKTDALDDINKIALAKRIAKKTRRIIIQNIVLALGVKAAVMVLAFLGYTQIYLAIFADVGVALLAILNATRALRVGGKGHGRS
jgi:Cd2+/Zn2+-exporting ATPase